jgi:RNA recognition motif-containing protein
MVKLFVSGFPLKIDEIELAKIFSLHGDLKTIKLVRDKKTRVCKGYGFIEVADQASADNIVEMLNGYEMGDKQLVVNIRPEEPEGPPKPPPRRPFSPSPSYSPRPSSSSGPSPEFKKKRPRRGM